TVSSIIPVVTIASVIIIPTTISSIISSSFINIYITRIVNCDTKVIISYKEVLCRYKTHSSKESTASFIYLDRVHTWTHSVQPDHIIVAIVSAIDNQFKVSI